MIRKAYLLPLKLIKFGIKFFNNMKKIFFLISLGIVLVSCGKKVDTAIALNKVGAITNTTTIAEIKTLFSKDSIVSRLTEGDLGILSAYIGNDTHLIYKKGGELLLSISPVNPLDSISKIKSVTIFGNVYKTKAEVGVSSTFKDLNVHHNIEKLNASFQLVTVFVKDINATFTMDKKEVGVKAFKIGEIDKAQIPEEAKFTSMTVWMED